MKHNMDYKGSSALYIYEILFTEGNKKHIINIYWKASYWTARKEWNFPDLRQRCKKKLGKNESFTSSDTDYQQTNISSLCNPNIIRSVWYGCHCQLFKESFLKRLILIRRNYSKQGRKKLGKEQAIIDGIVEYKWCYRKYP